MISIMGLDLSLNQTGWATGRTVYGTIIPPKSAADGIPRIDHVMRRILHLIQENGINLVVKEGYSFGTNIGRVRDSAELAGLVKWALWSKGIPYIDVPPSNVKKFATGRGGGNGKGQKVEKGEVIANAIRRLDYAGHNDNEADALWLFEMGMEKYQGHVGIYPPVHGLTAAMRSALDKVPWINPEIILRGGK